MLRPEHESGKVSPTRLYGATKFETIT